MKRFTPICIQWLDTCRLLPAAALCVLLMVVGGRSVQAKSHTFQPLGYRNTACSGWEHVKNPDTQTVAFTGTINSDGDVIGDFWYEYQNRWTRYAQQTGTSYELTLSNPPAGAYQLCWNHTTAGTQQATGTLTTTVSTTTVSDGADLTVTKRALSELVTPEELLTYEIAVINNGPGEAMQVTVEDTLPFGVFVDSIGPRDGSPEALSKDEPRATFLAGDVEVSCHLSDQEGQPVVTCDLGNLGVGQEVIIALSVLVTWEASEWDMSGTIRNKVEVEASNTVAPFEDDSAAAETPVWGEPIGGEPTKGTCTVTLCKLSAPAPRTANSPDVQASVTDAEGYPLRGVGLTFSFEQWISRGGGGNYRKDPAGTDSKKTNVGGIAVGSPLTTAGPPPVRAGLWTHVRVSVTTAQRRSCTEMVFEPGSLLEKGGTVTYPDIPEC